MNASLVEQDVIDAGRGQSMSRFLIPTAV